MSLYTVIDSPIDSLTLVTDGENLTGVYMADKGGVPHVDLSWERNDQHHILQDAKRQFCEYFAGERLEFDLPLLPSGTAFQQRVWNELKNISYGQTISYGEIALRIGNPNAFRAVGLANGANPIGIIIPCHRVIGASGKLVGYGGGLNRKQALLNLERQHRPITENRLELQV